MNQSIPSASSGLLLTQGDGVLQLALNRGDKGNALSLELVSAISEAVQQARDNAVRLLVISGVGKSFCTGFDLTALDQETDDSLLARFTRVELMLQAIHSAPFATLALAHGRAIGAGADLFCACSERWIVGNADFAFPGSAFGLVLGTARLAGRVGPVRAREWVESGALIDGSSALAEGLATRQLRHLHSASHVRSVWMRPPSAASMRPSTTCLARAAMRETPQILPGWFDPPPGQGSRIGLRPIGPVSCANRVVFHVIWNWQDCLSCHGGFANGAVPRIRVDTTYIVPGYAPPSARMFCPVM